MIEQNTVAGIHIVRLPVIHREFYRPAEVEFLWGDCAKAEKELGWKRDVDFKGLVAVSSRFARRPTRQTRLNSCAYTVTAASPHSR